MVRRQDLPLVDRPKHPVTKASGPYGHPIHPLLVTVPIGAWVASFVFDVASRAASGDDATALAHGAYWLIGIGVLGALVAAVFGVIDLLGIPRGTRAFITGLTHLVLNVTVVVLFAVSFLIRRADDSYDSPTSIGMIVLSAVALALLAVSGWLGGRLTYRFGVRVAEERDQADGFRHGSGGPTRPAA